MKNQISEFIQSIKDDLEHISKYIYENPEPGYHEFKAQKALTDTLEKYGFKVERNFLGLGTEFKAVYGNGSPTVAYLCEYDALPEIGHGCGHNIIGVCSMAAAIGLSKMIDKTGGKVIVFGTPAEETSGAKVAMAENGVFDQIDAVMMVHPADTTSESGSSLAMDAIEFTFKGRTAHAAERPEYGINALNACIETFNLINALRQHVTSDVRIHGIISEGGVAANIVPDRAVARFYIRSLKRSELDKVTEKVKNCARAAAAGTGAGIEIRNYELSYDNMITNHALSHIFSNNLRECGITDIKGQRTSMGSIDMGNVSHTAPAIHPYIQICEEGVAGHTREFAASTQCPMAKENMIKAACALAYTGYDLITRQDLLSEVKNEFQIEKGLF